MGEKGEAAYVILSGGSNPAPDLGSNGDFYYNNIAKSLFYRSGGEWELISRLSNTIQFKKTGINLGASRSTIIRFNLPYSVFQRSMVNIYVYKVSTTSSWHPLPGYIDSDDSFRIEFESGGNGKTKLRIVRRTGSGVFSSSQVRIVATEADRFETVSKVVDFNNYEAVSRYFNLNN